MDPKKRLDRFKFRHYVYERRGYEARKLDASSRRYRECWIAEEGKTLLAEDGFFTNPYVSGRLNKRGGWSYGRGRGVKAMADIKMLQRVRRATIQGAEKVVNPPTQGPDDADVPDLRPGQHNFMRPEYLMRNAGHQPIATGARPDVGMDFEESIKSDIRAPFLSKALNIPSEPRMLVDQVMELKAQAMAAAGPIVGEFQTEVLGPASARTFDILWRNRHFAPPPAGVAAYKDAIKPEFESPAARAQNLGIVSAIAQRNAIMEPVWKAKPELLELHDFAGEERKIAEILGIPADLYVAPAEYAKILAGMRQVAEEKQQAEALKDATTGAKNMAPMLSVIQGGKQEAA